MPASATGSSFRSRAAICRWRARSGPSSVSGVGTERALQRQIAALERNDDPVADAGIKTVYNYASPANRRRTGPYERFARMVRSDRYAPLVDHAEAVPGPVEEDWSGATCRVTVTGPDDQTRTYFSAARESRRLRR